MILTYTGAFKQYLLMDELLISFPEWLVGEGENRRCLLHLEGNGKGVLLIVPDGSDEQAIEAVILAHDPNALSVGEQEEEQRETVRNLLKNSALAGKTPEEVYAIVQGRIDGWSSLADAKADFREWMPLLFAYVVYLGNK